MCNDYEQAVFFISNTWNFQKLEACFIHLKVGVLLFGVCVCVFPKALFVWTGDPGDSVFCWCCRVTFGNKWGMTLLQVSFKNIYTPLGKLTWNLDMDPQKRRIVLETITFRFHVSFWGRTFFFKEALSHHFDWDFCPSRFAKNLNWCCSAESWEVPMQRTDPLHQISEFWKTAQVQKTTP